MPSCAIITRTYYTPYGTILLGSYEGRLCLCDWQAEKHHNRTATRMQHLLRAPMNPGNNPVLQQAATELDEYFAGSRRTFTLPLLVLGTEFQKRVWQELLTIPYGSTLSYGELAGRLGIPTAMRAVAHACSANVLSLFIPCHRIIGSKGKLAGYRGGLAAKHYLLTWECAPPQSTIKNNAENK